MRVPMFSLLFAAITLIQGCKTPANNGSQTLSVVGAQSTAGDFVVYFRQGDIVFRKLCPGSSVSQPIGCPTQPTNAVKNWSEFKDALIDQGMSVADANGIGEAMKGVSPFDGNAKPQLLAKIENAFNLSPSAATNPLPAWVGAPQTTQSNGSIPIPTEQQRRWH